MLNSTITGNKTIDHSNHHNNQKEKFDCMYKISSGEQLPFDDFNLKAIISKETLYSKPCQIHKTENQIFCFNCSKGICNYCRIEHQEHIISVKNNFLLRPQLEKQLFNKIDNEIKNTFELCYPKKLYDFFYNKLDKHFKIMTENLEKYRVQRLKELHIIFENMEKYAKDFNSYYKKCKSNVNKLLTDGKNFFPSNYFSEIVFLQNFNLVNEGMKNEKKILKEVQATKQRTVSYEDELSKALNDIEHIFKDTLNKSSTLEILKTKEGINPFDDFENVIDENRMLIEKFIGFIKKKKTVRGGANLGASTTSFADVTNQAANNTNNRFNSVEKDNDKTNLNEGSRNIRRLRFSDNNESMYKTNKSIANKSMYRSMMRGSDKEEIILDRFTNLKIYESAFISYIETGEIKFQKLNLRETSQIEKIMEASENNLNMTSKKLPKNVNAFLNPQNKIGQSYSVSEQLLNVLKVFVELNYNKGKLDKFQEDNNIKKDNTNNAVVTPLTYLEEEGQDYFQAIEGTNRIQLFDFRSKKAHYINIHSLCKEDTDYACFPYGCRSFYHEDKIFIFGGRDIYKEYKTILLYEVNTCKIKKIGEMLQARCYHSINYNHERKTLFIVGGESNSTSEAFCFLTMKSRPLPKMNFPRANPTLFSYNNQYIYAFCGFRDNIISSNKNNSIERLDISTTVIPNFKHKQKNFSYNFANEESKETLKPKERIIEFTSYWEKIDFSNQADIELQFEFVGIMPLTRSHAFLYGGYDKRSYHRSVVLIDFLEHKLISLEDKDFLELKSVILDDIKFNEIFDSLFFSK